MKIYIEKFRELLENPNVLNTRAISSQAMKMEGSTTIPEEGVHSSEWKLGASERMMI